MIMMTHYFNYGYYGTLQNMKKKIYITKRCKDPNHIIIVQLIFQEHDES